MRNSFYFPHVSSLSLKLQTPAPKWGFINWGNWGEQCISWYLFLEWKLLLSYFYLFIHSFIIYLWLFWMEYNRIFWWFHIILGVFNFVFYFYFKLNWESLNLEICNTQFRLETDQPTNLVLRQKSVLSCSLMCLTIACSKTNLLYLVVMTGNKGMLFHTIIIWKYIFHSSSNKSHI